MKNETMKDTSIKDNHQYGLDFIEDSKHLYGENYEEINYMRYDLFELLNDTHFVIQSLRTIIQNPVPISNQDIESFDKMYELVKEKYDLRKSTVKAINSIRKFAITYHLKDK